MRLVGVLVPVGDAVVVVTRLISPPLRVPLLPNVTDEPIALLEGTAGSDAHCLVLVSTHASSNEYNIRRELHMHHSRIQPV